MQMNKNNGGTVQRNPNKKKRRALTTMWVAFAAAVLLLAGCGGSTAQLADDASQSEGEPNRLVGDIAAVAAPPRSDNNNGDGESGDEVTSDPGPSVEAIVVEEASNPTEIEEDPIDEAASVVLASAGITGDGPIDAALKAELAAALLPAGASGDDSALAQVLAARLGPEVANVSDVDVLIKALVDEVPDIGSIDSVEDLVGAVEDWATTTVVRFGDAGGAAAITTATSFDQAVALINQPGVIVDLLPGVAVTDVEGVDISVDEASRQITVTGEVRDPIAAQAVVQMNWNGGVPVATIEVRSPGMTLAQLLPQASLGQLATVGVSDMVVTVDDLGLAASAALVPSDIPGVNGVELGSVAVPVQFNSDGFGPFGGDEISPITIAVPLDLAPYGPWNIERSGELAVTLSSSPAVQYQERVVARFGGTDHVFVGTAGAGNGAAEFALVREGEWAQPFGTPWLTLSNVELIASSSADTTAAIVRGGYTLGTKSGVLELEVNANDGARVTGTLDDFGAADLNALAQSLAGSDLLPPGVSVPGDVLSLQDVSVSFQTGANASSLTLSGLTQVLGQSAEATFSVVSTTGGRQVPVLVVQPQDVSLAGLLPVLAGNEVVGDLRLPNSAFVFTAQDARLSGAAIDPTLADLLGALPGAGDIRLPSGVSLAGTIPGGLAPAVDDVKSLLGMDPAAPVRLAGTIPVGSFSGGGGDFVLDAQLPALSPADSAPWLVSAELGLRITSQPSVGIVGAMTLDIGGDVQTFEIEASVARTPAGVAIEIVGQLGNPWESPFDEQWLTLNHAVLKLALEPARGATIGFSGDIVVGSKDLQGAVAITLSPAGAPTNFIFEAASAEGVSLGDVADLYALISGQPRPPVEAALPAIEVRNINVRFAPVGDADLGVEQGFRLAGELWMSSGPGGQLEEIVGVDIEVSDAGIRADGFLTDFNLGPVQFDDTTVSLDVSAADQRLAFAGGIDVNGSGVDVAMAVTSSEMSFRTTADFGAARQRLRWAPPTTCATRRGESRSS